MEDKKLEKRSLDQINCDGSILIDKSKSPFIVFDFNEDPYTMIYLRFIEGLDEKHLMVLRLILRKIDPQELTINLNSEPIEEDLTILMSIHIVIHEGMDYMNNIDFGKISNFSFIESIENKEKIYRFKVSKNFYKVITKYFYF